MYLTKYEIEVNATGATTAYGYSGLPVYGLLHAIQYTVNTTAPIASTASFTISREYDSTEAWSKMLTASASNDNWYYMPRYKTADSTGASTAWNSTAWGFDYYPISDERIKVSLVGATSASAGTITAWVQGGA